MKLDLDFEWKKGDKMLYNFNCEANFCTENLLAANSDDEFNLRKAENQVLKRRKVESRLRLQKQRKAPTATATSDSA